MATAELVLESTIDALTCRTLVVANLLGKLEAEILQARRRSHPHGNMPVTSVTGTASGGVRKRGATRDHRLSRHPWLAPL